MPLIVYLLAIAFVVAGAVTPLHVTMGGSRAGFFVHLVIAFAGSLAGAFLTMGDAPFLVANPWITPQIVAVFGAVLASGVALGISSLFRTHRSEGSQTAHDELHDNGPPPMIQR